MTSNYLDSESDAAILCSYSETVRNLFLSMNAYHYPCSYKPVFYNQALLSLLDCETEAATMSSSKRSRATKCRQAQAEQDVPCAAMKIDNKAGDQLHACRYYAKTDLWPDQFLVYDTSKGKTNSLLSPWRAENEWDSDDFDLLNRNFSKKKVRPDGPRSPHSSRLSTSASSYLLSSQNEKRLRLNKEARGLGLNNSNTTKHKMNPLKADSRTINGWMLPKDPQNIPTPELIVPFEHNLSWIQYAYQYRERKGLVYPHHDKIFSSPKGATMVYPSKSDFQKTIKKISNIDLSFNDIDQEVPLHTTDRMCISDRSSNRPKVNTEKVTLKGNMMHLNLPGNESPEPLVRRTSSDHKRISMKGNNIRHELKPTLIKSKTSIASETSPKENAWKSLSSGLVTVCRSRPTIPSNLHGRLCISSLGTPAHRVAPQKSAGKRCPSNKITETPKQVTKPTLSVQVPRIVGSYIINKHQH